MDLVVFLAPGNDLYENGCQAGSFRRELVKYLSLAFRMPGLGDDAGAFEQAEPVGKDIGGDTFPAFQKITVCVESLEHQIPDNEQRPFVPEYVEGRADRAVRPEHNFPFIQVIPIIGLANYKYFFIFTLANYKLIVKSTVNEHFTGQE